MTTEIKAVKRIPLPKNRVVQMDLSGRLYVGKAWSKKSYEIEFRANGEIVLMPVRLKEEFI